VKLDTEPADQIGAHNARFRPCVGLRRVVTAAEIAAIRIISFGRGLNDPYFGLRKVRELVPRQFLKVPHFPSPARAIV
jgi:hypothetical protein